MSNVYYAMISRHLLDVNLKGTPAAEPIRWWGHISHLNKENMPMNGLRAMPTEPKERANKECDRRMLSQERFKCSKDYSFHPTFFCRCVTQNTRVDGSVRGMLDFVRLLTETSIYIWLVRDICFERVYVSLIREFFFVLARCGWNHCIVNGVRYIRRRHICSNSSNSSGG